VEQATVKIYVLILLLMTIAAFSHFSRQSTDHHALD
jgi:hypothetical protein